MQHLAGRLDGLARIEIQEPRALVGPNGGAPVLSRVVTADKIAVAVGFGPPDLIAAAQLDHRTGHSSADQYVQPSLSRRHTLRSSIVGTNCERFRTRPATQTCLASPNPRNSTSWCSAQALHPLPDCWLHRKHRAIPFRLTPAVPRGMIGPTSSRHRYLLATFRYYTAPEQASPQPTTTARREKKIFRGVLLAQDRCCCVP